MRIFGMSRAYADLGRRAMGRKIILLVFGIAVLLLILFVLCGELKPLPAALGGGLLLLFDPLNSRLKNSSLLFRAFVCGVMATGAHCMSVLFNLLPAGMLYSDCRFGWLFALAVWTAVCIPTLLYLEMLNGLNKGAENRG